MPTYEYDCPSCGARFETERRVSDDSLQECPNCGFSACKRLISHCSVHFKGGGWTNTAASDIDRAWLSHFAEPEPTEASTKIADFMSSKKAEE